MPSNIEYHSVTENEQQQAINLWQQIFPNCAPGFYKCYYSSASSPYQHGDTLGAWSNGNLISTVHICRLKLHNNDETYLCGGIANVATLPEYREMGISRYLLEQAINKMRHESFDVSMLYSVRHSHYRHVGFEPLSFSRWIFIDLHENIDAEAISSNCDWNIANVNENVINIYHKQPRSLQMNRSLEYFKDWINCNWQQDKAILHIISNEGYIVMNKGTMDDFYSISEWRATTHEIEARLLLRASIKVRQMKSNRVRLAATPVFVDYHWIEKNVGTISLIETDECAMIRNINLTVDQFNKLKSLYLSGQATLWPGDFF